jgi:dTDP-4-dehydrorhamnose reductase
MKNVLITGVSGYIGPYLTDSLAKNNELKITGLYNTHPVNSPGIESIRCDLTDFDKLQKIFESINPDIVFHLASVTPTRIKDQKDDYIELFNRDVTGMIAELCTANNSLIVYTSTDLVYENGSNLNEDSSPLKPLSIYAKTKLLGERAVKEKASKFIIFRLALVYGFSRSSYISFFDECCRSLRSGKEVRAFYDQFRNPVYAEDAAEILSGIPGKYSGNDTINLCGEEVLSRYEMCVQMAEEFGLDRSLVKPASCEEFTAYPMVKNLTLNNQKSDHYGFNTNSYKINLRKSLKYKP